MGQSGTLSVCVGGGGGGGGGGQARGSARRREAVLLKVFAHSRNCRLELLLEIKSYAVCVRLFLYLYIT